jgi:uncharacterized membrane protein
MPNPAQRRGPTQRAAITIHRPMDEVQRLWDSSEHRPAYIQDADAAVRFVQAPGDRGTEIHVDLAPGGSGARIGELVQKLTGAAPRAKVMDDLRRFKQVVETGVVVRSEGVPEGERAERKLKQRPAQPLSDADLEKVGV